MLQKAQCECGTPHTWRGVISFFFFPLKTLFDVPSVFFFFFLESRKSPDKAHWDWFALIFFTLCLFHLLWQKSYFTFQFSSRETHTRARTHCNYWSTAARGVLCNLCSTSQQQGRMAANKRRRRRRSRKGHNRVSGDVALTLQVRSQNDPLGAGSSGVLFYNYQRELQAAVWWRTNLNRRISEALWKAGWGLLLLRC